MLTITVKSFEELNVSELYAILQLRSEVFVVEQHCVYQDLDGKDVKALHVIGKVADELVAYTRIFKPLDYFEKASIGRVAVRKSSRKNGFGGVIMKAAIAAIHNQFNETTIRVSAQQYLKQFYNDLGFQQEGDGYLEDGIPHIAMVRK